MYGFYRIGLCVPELRVADTEFNREEILKLAREAKCAIALFPELAVTGASCQDLFHNTELLASAERSVEELCKALPENGTVFVIGSPVRVNGKLFDASLVIRNGRICGIVPKISCEKRLFSSGLHEKNLSADFAGQKEIPFGADLLFKVKPELIFGIEIGNDAQGVIPPSSKMAPAGATLILNPAFYGEFAGQGAFRKELTLMQSARCIAAYASVSAGVHESTTDLVCGGHALLAENGTLLFENERFFRKSALYTSDIDLKKVCTLRLGENFSSGDDFSFRTIPVEDVPVFGDLQRRVERMPFVPEDEEERASRCSEIFAIQTAGLAKRFEHAHSSKLVIGISGGLDSTLALLVCAGTMRLLGRPVSDVISVTMPGFGTTDRTYENAVGLCRGLGTDFREIGIREACLEHFRSIGHDPENRNVVYENAQARERTQILLDIANGVNGLVAGTGDLSESAMGWCTYNGDHISMYGVNASVPKTLMPFIIRSVGQRSFPEVMDFLQDVIDTPVSPELLPAGKDGEIRQKTEDLLGPYMVHDFFLYHFLKYGAESGKLLFLAEHAFRGEFTKERLAVFLRTFLKRFFSQQFKRSCSPDAPKVGSIDLSPRGELLMPSDASAAVWLSSLDQ